MSLRTWWRYFTLTTTFLPRTFFFTTAFVFSFLTLPCHSLSCCSWITSMWMRRWRVTTEPSRFGTSVRTLWGNTPCRPERWSSRTRGWETWGSCSSDTPCLPGVSGTHTHTCTHTNSVCLTVCNHHVVYYNFFFCIINLQETPNCNYFSHKNLSMKKLSKKM